MIINNLDTSRTFLCPDKAQSVLYVDADTVLTLPVAFQ